MIPPTSKHDSVKKKKKMITSTVPLAQGDDSLERAFMFPATYMWYNSRENVLLKFGLKVLLARVNCAPWSLFHACRAMHVWCKQRPRHTTFTPSCFLFLFLSVWWCGGGSATAVVCAVGGSD